MFLNFSHCSTDFRSSSFGNDAYSFQYVCKYYEFCDSNYITYDIVGLKANLQKELFGQHIVEAELIPALSAHIRHLDRSKKPLVMSFQGSIGTGKTFVTELIIKHLYRNGDHSKFVHKYMGRKDFTVVDKVDEYCVSFNAPQ